jgi:hypothetical protein
MRLKGRAQSGKATLHPADQRCAVSNRYTSEAQSPAPGFSHFGIGWDILEGQERSWVGF